MPEDQRLLLDVAGDLTASGRARWLQVDSDSDICIVDPQNPKSIRALMGLSHDAIVVYACRDGAEVPKRSGLRVRQPFDPRELRGALAQAESVLSHSASSLAPPQAEANELAESNEDVVLIESEASTDSVVDLTSLGALAAHLHERPRSGLVCVGPMQFVLQVEAGVYYSSARASELHGLRTAGDVPIRVMPTQSVRAGLNLAPRRLEAFLWELGLSAGNGSLLPTIDPDGYFRIRRWPPLTGTRDRSKFFKVSAAISKHPARSAAIARFTRTPLEEVHDYLNACWMVDCLEVLQEEPQEAVATKRPEAPQATRSLLSRIRTRLGL